MEGVMSLAKASDGAQTIDRAVAILRELSSAAHKGLRLTDLQRITGLSKPTIHRILRSLTHHGLVTQDPPTKRYRLGHELAVFGWSVTRTNYDIRELCENEMLALAEETGDTAFLTVRSGIDSACIDRKMGPYPIKAFTVDVGTRRPLPVGAGGLAIISCLHYTEAEAVYLNNLERLKQYPNINERLIRRAVLIAKSERYALSDGFVLKGVRGLAMPLRNSRGEAIAALSIAALNERISGVRLPALVAILGRLSASVERKVAKVEREGLGV